MRAPVSGSRKSGRGRDRMAVVSGVERLEVSIDGLTLSPDQEEEPPQGADGGEEEAAEEDEEAGQLSMEQRWGFSLEELYSLALKFFKGERHLKRGGVPAVYMWGLYTTKIRLPPHLIIHMIGRDCRAPQQLCIIGPP